MTKGKCGRQRDEAKWLLTIQALEKVHCVGWQWALCSKWHELLPVTVAIHVCQVLNWVKINTGHLQLLLLQVYYKLTNKNNTPIARHNRAFSTILLQKLLFFFKQIKFMVSAHIFERDSARNNKTSKALRSRNPPLGPIHLI